jgi:hypothetical protein
MTIQLEKMATASGLNVLAYFLGMAKAEGARLDRNITDPESSVDSERIGPIHPDTGNDNSF